MTAVLCLQRKCNDQFHSLNTNRHMTQATIHDTALLLSQSMETKTIFYRALTGAGFDIVCIPAKVMQSGQAI